MRLEIIPFGAAKLGRPPLLLIHGAYCGAWVWQRHFLPFLETRGFHGIAISLRGHGKSEGHALMDFLGMQDFTDDAEYAVKTLRESPIVIGHSMGGMIAQLLSLRLPVKGLALLASVPPHGLSNAASHMWAEKPALFTELGVALSLGGWAGNPQQLSDSLFSADTPSWERIRYLSRFQRESTRAAIEILMPQLLQPPSPPPPAFVLGGDQDQFIPMNAMVETAEFWNARAEIVSGLPHAMMLDERWMQAAQPLADWLDTV